MKTLITIVFTLLVYSISAQTLKPPVPKEVLASRTDIVITQGGKLLLEFHLNEDIFHSAAEVEDLLFDKYVKEHSVEELYQLISDIKSGEKVTNVRIPKFLLKPTPDLRLKKI